MSQALKSDHEFDAFISYSWSDQDWVRNLADQLESETIDGLPNSRRLKMFTDELEIEPGENIPRKLSEGLQKCRYFLPVLSPEFLDSEFSAFEWTHVVAEDPANRQGRMIPLLLRDLTIDGKDRINLRAPFKSLKYLDFRKEGDFKKRYSELLRRVRGLPIARRRNRRPLGMQVQAAGLDPVADSQAEYPDRCTEVLLSNLIPLQQLPRVIFSCPVKSRKPKAFYEGTGFEWPVLLKSGKAHSFADFSEHKERLRDEVTEGSPAEESVVDWYNSEVKRRDLVQLLNKCLESYLRGMGIRREVKGGRRFHFQLNPDGSDKEFKIGDDASRTVAAVKESKDGTRRFFVHHAARMGFHFIGERLFLEIDPCYLFTEDGISPIKGVAQGKLSFQWSGRQSNPDILRNTVFWVRVLTKGHSKLSIPTGNSPVILEGLPATSKLNSGISDDALGVASLLRQAEKNLTAAADDIEIVFDEQDELEGDDDE